MTPKLEGIVMIGEIGANMEAEAAQMDQTNNRKRRWSDLSPGQTAPPGLAHGTCRSAIIGGADDTAAAKMKIMAEMWY